MRGNKRVKIKFLRRNLIRSSLLRSQDILGSIREVIIVISILLDGPNYTENLCHRKRGSGPEQTCWCSQQVDPNRFGLGRLEMCFGRNTSLGSKYLQPTREKDTKLNAFSTDEETSFRRF